MPKQTDSTVVVNVSELTVTGAFSVSTKTRPEKQGPFTLIVKYANVDEALRAAFSTTRIIVQNPLRKLHESGQSLGLKPGATLRANGKGERFVSDEERNAHAMVLILSKPEVLRNAPIAQRIKAAELLGLPVPQEWRDAAAAAAAVSDDITEADDDEGDEGDEGDAPKYDKSQLSKLGMAKLQVLAQNEEIAKYGEMTRAELIEELALIENA